MEKRRECRLGGEQPVPGQQPLLPYQLSRQQLVPYKLSQLAGGSSWPAPPAVPALGLGPPLIIVQYTSGSDAEARLLTPQTEAQPSFNHQHCSNDHHWHQPRQSFDLAASNNMEILLVLLFWPKWKPEPSSGNWLINKLILPPLLQILPYTGVGEGSSTPSALPFFLPGPIKQQLTDKVGLPKAILRSTPSHSIYGILFQDGKSLSLSLGLKSINQKTYKCNKKS